MNEKSPQERYLEWSFMTPMEQALWGTTIALNSLHPDGGVGSADALLLKLRSLSVTRGVQLEPEFQAAKANEHIEYDDFAVWYPIAHRLQHRYDPSPRDYEPMAPEAIKAAYERYAWGRSDYW